MWGGERRRKEGRVGFGRRGNGARGGVASPGGGCWALRAEFLRPWRASGLSSTVEGGEEEADPATSSNPKSFSRRGSSSPSFFTRGTSIEQRCHPCHFSWWPSHRPQLLTARSLSPTSSSPSLPRRSTSPSSRLSQRRLRTARRNLPTRFSLLTGAWSFQVKERITELTF